MATKERAGGRLLRFPRRDTVNLSRRAFMGMAEAGWDSSWGLCCRGRRSLGSIPPSGGGRGGGGRVGDQRVLHPGRGLPGVPLSGGMTDGMRYAASAILTYSVAFAFYDAKFYKRAWFMPAIAAVLSALTGIICRGGEGWYGEDLVYFVTEVLFTGAAAYGYRIIFTQWPEALDGPRNLTPRQSIGLMMLAGTVLMALARVEILGTFSMGRLLAAVGVMLAARKGVGEGVLAGACAGVALDLASGEQPYYSMVFALAGLACGLCKGNPKDRGRAGLRADLLCGGAVELGRGLHVGLPMEAVVGGHCLLGAARPPEEGTGPSSRPGGRAGTGPGEQPAGNFP